MRLNGLSIIVLLCAAVAFQSPAGAQASVKEAEQLEFAQGLLSRGMYDMAVLQCQKFIAEFPKSPSLEEAYLSLGEAYFLSQDFKKAADAFNQFKQLYPNSEQLPLSVLRLSQIALQQQNYDDALKNLNSSDMIKKVSGAMLQSYDFYIAKAYAGKADNANALAYYQKASQVEGTFAYTADALKEIGKIDAQNGKYDDAMQAYTQSLKAADDDTLKGELSYRMAEVSFLSGKYADAIKGFEQVVDQYPTLGFTLDALSSMLLSCFNLEQYDQLLAAYQKYSSLIKQDESCFGIHEAAILAYIELGQFDAANALLDRVMAFSGLKPQEKLKVYIKKADILVRQKKYKDALSLLDAQVPATTDGADEAYFLRAEANFGLAEYDQAFNFYENVFLNFPGSRFYKAALLGQANARQEAGRFKEAHDLFFKYYGIQDDPALKAEALYDTLISALKAKDADAIVSAAQQYLKDFPTGAKYGEVLLLLADHEGSNNQSKDAIALLQDYLAKAASVESPNSVHFLLGYNEALLGNMDEALKDYAQVDGQKEGGKFYFDALKNMAIICMNQKHLDQARVYFDLLISKADQNDLQVGTYIWVCNQFLKEQKYTDVLRIAGQAEKRFKGQDLQEVQYFEAEALRGLGRCDDAGKVYAQVIVSKQKDAYTGSAHIGWGLCLAQAKKYDDAKKEFQSSLDENADDFTITAHARFEMANLLEAQGSLEDALKMYLLIATIYDDDYFCSESLLRAAKISEKLKRNADALKMYSEILDKYKKSTAALYAQGRVGHLK